MNNENNIQTTSDYPEIPLKFIINNKLSLKEIGTFATVYDMYLNGEMPITVSGICQRTSYRAEFCRTLFIKAYKYTVAFCILIKLF